jgi:hypothetical protein
MFASASEVGYDPCVTLCSDRCNYTYRFEMGTKEERAFRTRRCIVEYRSLLITGRSTLRPVSGCGKQSKWTQPTRRRRLHHQWDVWFDHDASTEKDIQAKNFPPLKSSARETCLFGDDEDARHQVDYVRIRQRIREVIKVGAESNLNFADLHV